MKSRLLFTCWLITVVLTAINVSAQTENRAGEPVSDKVDRALGKFEQGAKELAQGVREGFEQVRAAVERMGVESRVYSRLHWDKGLVGASISIEIQPNHVAVLRGTVASEAAKAKAAQLASDTIGVDSIRNELAVDQKVSLSRPK